MKPPDAKEINGVLDDQAAEIRPGDGANRIAPYGLEELDRVGRALSRKTAAKNRNGGRPAGDSADGDGKAAGDIIADLANLEPIEYDRARVAVAERLGIRVSTLDEEVRKLRGESETSESAGRPCMIEDTEPFATSVRGVELFDELESVARTFIRAEAWQIHTAILWAVHTHCVDLFNCSPRIIYDAPDENCGKTACLTHVFGGLANRTSDVTGVTVAPFFRMTEKHRPTWLIDEADVFLRMDAEILAALNAGFEPHGCVPRCVGPDFEVRMFPVFGPVALAGRRLAKKLPPTLLSRAVVIHLQRAADGDVEFFEGNKHRRLFDELRSKIARWVADNLQNIRKDALIPAGMVNRNRMKWTPFLQISRAVSDEWYRRAVDAWQAELAELDKDDGKASGVRLLADIKAVFDRTGRDRIETAELIDELISDTHGPWHHHNVRASGADRHITPRQVAEILRGYRIVPRSIRPYPGAKTTPKGYYRSAFDDAWNRYLRRHPPVLSATPPQATAGAGFSVFSSATRTRDVADRKVTKPSNGAGCGGVADDDGVCGVFEKEEAFRRGKAVEEESVLIG